MSRPIQKVMPVRKHLQVVRRAGMSGNYCAEDFGSMGGMGDIWSDLGTWASNTVNKTLASATSSAQKAASSAVQNYVMKITGQDGSTKSINLTAAQKAQYDSTGTLPAGVIPAGYLLPEQSFLEKYQTPLMIAGGLTVAVLLGLMVYKTVSNKGAAK